MRARMRVAARIRAPRGGRVAGVNGVPLHSEVAR